MQMRYTLVDHRPRLCRAGLPRLHSFHYDSGVNVVQYWEQAMPGIDAFFRSAVKYAQLRPLTSGKPMSTNPMPLVSGWRRYQAYPDETFKLRKTLNAWIWTRESILISWKAENALVRKATSQHARND